MESPDSSAVSLPSLRRRGNRILSSLEEMSVIHEFCYEDGEAVPAFMKQNVKTLLMRIHLFLNSIAFVDAQSLSESSSDQRLLVQLHTIADAVRASIAPLNFMLAMPESEDDEDDANGPDDDDDHGSHPGPFRPSPVSGANTTSASVAS